MPRIILLVTISIASLSNAQITIADSCRNGNYGNVQLALDEALDMAMFAAEEFTTGSVKSQARLYGLWLALLGREEVFAEAGSQSYRPACGHATLAASKVISAWPCTHACR